MKENSDVINHIREFNRFYTNILGILNQHILNSDFSLTEARILFDLNEYGCCTANELSCKLNIDKSYMSRILKKFEKKELILKQMSSEDSRIYIIGLSEKGKSIINQLISDSNNQIKQLIFPLSNEECSEIYAAVDIIEKHFSKAIDVQKILSE